MDQLRIFYHDRVKLKKERTDLRLFGNEIAPQSPLKLTCSLGAKNGGGVDLCS